MSTRPGKVTSDQFWVVRVIVLDQFLYRKLHFAITVRLIEKPRVEGTRTYMDGFGMLVKVLRDSWRLNRKSTHQKTVNRLWMECFEMAVLVLPDFNIVNRKGTQEHPTSRLSMDCFVTLAIVLHFFSILNGKKVPRRNRLIASQGNVLWCWRWKYPTFASWKGKVPK